MAKGLADAGRITKPVLIVHGEADRLTSVRGSRQLATTVTSSDCTLRTWPGAYHELHHEPERVEVLDTIVSWLQHHLNE